MPVSGERSGGLHPLSPAAAASNTPRRWLFGLVLATVAFKVWLSAVFPVTGDEAYFIYWGVSPALGYYDHPPMVGWLLALLLKISDAPWVLRLPVTLLPAFIALVLYGVLRRLPELDQREPGGREAAEQNSAEQKAAWTAIGFLLLPAQVWNIFITTDTPLVFWSFLSGLAFWRAVRLRSDVGIASDGWFAMAGALLGLAFLSKYFAALLALAYVVYVLVSPRGQRPWRGLAITLLVVLPFAGLNLYWNWQDCWANIMFNLYNRNDDAGLSWRTPLLYGVSLLYMLPPLALFILARHRGWMARLAGDASLRLMAVLGGVPYIAFAVLSLGKQIGLHWMLSFVPFFCAAAALALPRRALVHSAVFLAVFSAIHVAGIAAGASLPLQAWKSSRLYDGIVFNVRIDELLAQLKPYEGEYAIAADGYSAAVIASYYRMRDAEHEGGAAQAGAVRDAMQHGDSPYVFVFGEASSHARQDDLVMDFRRLQGRNILVLRKSPPQEADYKPYFATVEYRSFDVAGATFHLVLGRGFNYESYRAAVLDKVRERYYALPRWLPQAHCVFCERYADAGYCPVR